MIEKLKLRPLCTFFNHHFNTDIGLSNLQNLTHYFDLILHEFTPFIDDYKEIVRTDLLSDGNLNRFNTSSQISFAVKHAKRNRIPLILWGKHQGVEYTGMFSKEDRVEFSAQYWRMFDSLKKDFSKYENLSMGARNLIKRFDLMEDYDPNNSPVTGIYLSNYLNWSTVANYNLILEKYSFQRAKVSRSCFDFEYSGNYFYYSWHDVFRYLKFGYGKVTEQLSELIRQDKISRMDAKDLSDAYLLIRPLDEEIFKDFFNLSKKEFIHLLESFEFNASFSDLVNPPEVAYEKACRIFGENFLRTHSPVKGPFTFKKMLEENWKK